MAAKERRAVIIAQEVRRTRLCTQVAPIGDNSGCMDIVVPDEFRSLWVEDDRHPIVKYPAKILRQKAQPLQRVTKRTRELIERLEKAMKMANGIGLAAPQLGVSERVILIVDAARKVIPLINPEVVKSEGSVVGEEGCLSLPGLYGDVERFSMVEVKALDRSGKPVRLRLEGTAARIAQHEIDHLDGVLFIDKVDFATIHWSWPPGVDE